MTGFVAVVVEVEVDVVTVNVAFALVTEPALLLTTTE